MAGYKYTPEQLEHLRDSPLVKKPEGLPSIAQWMDVPAEQNNPNNTTTGVTNRRARNIRGGDAATEAINNPMGQFGRRHSTQPGDDIQLGPPKLNFTSAMRATKKDTTTAVTSADGEQLGDRFPKADRERWRERDGERNRDKPHPNGRRAAREEGEGWTPGVKGRKSLGQEDFDRGFGRNGDRDVENGESNPRRSGNNRWARRDENVKEGEGNRFPPGGQGGWRDRERNREREKDREWTRGAKEEDPEWMDEPAEKKEPKAHTQEDFQRWLEQNRAKGNKAPIEEHDEPHVEVGHAEELASATVTAQPPLKMALGLEPGLGSMFGAWGKEPLPEQSLEAAPVKAKPDKKSRFMNMFAKPEEPAAAAPIPQEEPASPGPLPESNADREGFNRILQMLGGVNLGAPQQVPSPGIPPPTNGNRQGGLPLDFPHYSSPPIPETQKPRASQQQMHANREQQALLENILAQQRPATLESRPSQQGRFSSMSPDNALQDRFGAPRAEPRYPGEDYPMQQPSRNQNMQDPNLAAILNNRREDVNRERESKEFLLTLMQQPRNTPPQMLNQNLTRQPQDNQNMSFFDQPGQRPQGQPKGRGGPPPGFMEDPRIFENEMMMRREAEHRERERQLQMRELQQQEVMRKKPRGMPMGFPGHEDPTMGLQRRNTAGEIPRQLTNMGIPSQAVSDMPAMYGGRPPGMPPTPQDRPNIAPPPGFPMRQPPGLGGPGPQQQMGAPSFSAGNTPLGHPPGFPPPNGMQPGGFPGGPGGPGNGMRGPPPQGYFPTNYGPPPPHMRGGDDPRLMFEPQFGGPGPRQQGRPGPPNMY